MMVALFLKCIGMGFVLKILYKVYMYMIDVYLVYSL